MCENDNFSIECEIGFVFIFVFALQGQVWLKKIVLLVTNAVITHTFSLRHAHCEIT